MNSLINRIMNFLADKFTQPVVSFTGTRTSSASAGTCYGMYDKVTNSVRLHFRASNSSNISTSATLFTIAAAYRPSATKSGTCTITNSSGTVIAGACSITANGEIKQGSSSACRTIHGIIEYIK